MKLIDVARPYRVSFFTLVLVFCVCSFGFAQANRVNRTRQPQEGQEAQVDGETESVVLQIDGGDRNSGELRMDSQTLVGLLQSTALTDPVFASALSGEPAAARKFVTIAAMPNNYRFVNLSVTVRSGAPGYAPGVAKKIAQGLCDRLRTAVEQSAKASSAVVDARRGALEQELAAAKERLEAASKALAEAREAGGGMNNNRDNLAYQRQNLEQQKQQIELNLIGVRARMKALAEVAAATTQPSQPAAQVPNDSPWAQVIDLRAKKLEVVRKKAQAGTASSDEVAEAEAALAEARAYAMTMSPEYVARRRSDGSYSRDNDSASLRVTAAENEARLTLLNEQLAKLPTAKGAGVAENYSWLQQEEQQARNEVANLQSQLSESRRGNRQVTPVVLTVLDGSGGK